MSDRGFASMDKAKQRAISALGGKTAHKLGVAHTWTKETAAAAGRIGGKKSLAGRLAARKAREARSDDGA